VILDSSLSFSLSRVCVCVCVYTIHAHSFEPNRRKAKMPRLPSNFAAGSKKKPTGKGDAMKDGDGSESEEEDEDGGYTVIGEDVTDSSASEGEENDGGEEGDAMMAPPGTNATRVIQRPKVWRPEENEFLEGGEGQPPPEMEYDSTAYDCLHAFSHEWPSLSFDILKDDMGDERAQFPHAFFMVSGTQADHASKNALSISRVGRLKKTGGGTKTKKKDSKNNRSSKNKNSNNSDSDSDSDEDSDDSESDTDDFDASNPSKSGKPTLHVSSISHPGGINRVRLMPQNTAICATWSDSGHVLAWDISTAFRSLQNSVEDQKNQNVVNEKKLKIAPKKVHSKHKEEGYALDWSSVSAGRLASGDNTGSIHVWEPMDSSNVTDWNIDCGYTDGHDGKSVEDIQWSPSEATVFASCGGDGGISVWDTRQKPKPAIRVKAAENCDVNVMSWNRLANCMIATGLDDGGLKIWDLRHFDPKGKTNPKPVAQFTFHRGHVSSVDWSPFDSAMLLSAASDNTVCVWDLAVERDAEEEAQAMAENESNAEIPDDLPPQLMFVHQGITDPKEAKFHPQIPGLIVSTALDGFHCFKPFNVGPET